MSAFSEEADPSAIGANDSPADAALRLWRNPLPAKRWPWIMPRPSAGRILSGAAQMSEREGRKFFFLLQAFLAALFLILGIALAIEAASGGYGMGLVIVSVMATGPGVVFFILAAMAAATAMHLRP
jgi:hypothetical protein